MKRGFMALAVEIVKEYPGHTALEVAREALDFDSDLSDAQKVSKEQSLSTTLNRQVQTGQEKRIRRERVSGLYRYFPVSGSSASGSSIDVVPLPGGGKNIVVQISLSTQELEDIDNLVSIVDKFHNRNEAISWLVMEGITAKRAYLDKVADKRKQVERLKTEVAV